MKNLFILVILLCSFSSYSQKPPVKFGNFTKEEVQMEYYEHDSSAAAVVLCDYGYAYINITTGRLIFERHTRIKILKKEGLDWANFSIPLYHQGTNSENISNLKAVTYNFNDGTKTSKKISKSSVFTEKFNNEINLYKFALEEVKVGSILEVSYKINSEFFFNFPSWKFQSTIPVVWSEYRADIPEFFTYIKYMQGYLRVDINEVQRKSGQYNFEAHRWVVENAPAFKEEPYMTCEDDYISKINFALSHYKLNGIHYDYMGSWDKIKEQLIKNDYVGGVVDGSGFLNKTTKDLIEGIVDPKDKIKVIYDYVKESLMWNGVSTFATDNLRTAFKEGKGTSADINLALASMLKTAKLDVDLVLISTRDHGFIRQQFSMLKQFNYLLCAVNLGNERILLDATDRALPMGVLPERCLNGQGLLVSKNSAIEWVPLGAVERTKTMASSNLILDKTGSLKGEVNFTRTLYDAHNVRKDYRSKGEEVYLKNIMEKTSWNIVNKEFMGFKEMEEEVKEKYEITVDDYAIISGNLAYINPYIAMKIDENPFKSLTREYPVDFARPFENIYLSQITIPDNFTIESLPQRQIIKLPDNAGKFTLSVINSGNEIYITSNFAINKSLFVQNEYDYLREFYNHVIALQAEQIVLKKIN